MDGPDNVIVANFKRDDDAYEALTHLKQLDAQGQIDLCSAAVVVRDEDGKIVVKDEIDDHAFEGTATGGILGLLIGIIGGPLGILVGGSLGLLGGVVYDVVEEEHAESVLGHVSRSVRVGHATLLAEAVEPSPEVIDNAVGRLGGEVARYDVMDVEAEISAAEEAQRAARKKAHKELREQREVETEAQVHSKIEALKSKFHHTKHDAHTGAAAS